MREILVGPGPTEVDIRVIQALCRPSISHHDRRFVRYIDEACEMLQDIFQTKEEIIILTASGRGGLEAAIASIVEPGDKVAIVVNGTFGRMLEAIVKRTAGVPISIELPFGQAVDLEKVEEVVAVHKPKVIAAVHSETSTGALNPAAEIGRIAKENGLYYVLDTVSCMGGADIKTDAWGVDICATGSQKGLASLPGLAIVSVNDRVWTLMKERKSPIQSFYFDLQRWMQMWIPKERGGEVMYGYRRLPVTMATHLLYALHEAVKMIQEEGLASRFERHLVAGKATRSAIKSVGCRMFPDSGIESPTVSAFFPPHGISAAELTRLMREEYGVLVSGGLEEYWGKIVRIGHMGNTASLNYLVPTIAALELSLRELGHEVEIGSGVAALRQAWSNGNGN